MAKKAKSKGNGDGLVLLKNRVSIFRNTASAIAEIAKQADVDAASVRRVRDGKPVRRGTGIKVIRSLNSLESLGLTPEGDLIDA